MFLKLFLQKLNHTFFQRACVILLGVFLLTSCTDSGCIDADDFGEYEAQTLEVPSNASQENCAFDYGKELTDPDQGSGIRACLTSGNTTITDETGLPQQSPDGCNGFSNASFRNICASNCVQLCNSRSSSNSNGAEPNWVSTDEKVSGKNIGVTIRPGSQIMIRAIGSVVLGDLLEYPNIYVQSVNQNPHSYNNLWAETFFDVRRNQSIFVKFSGLWTDGADSPDSLISVGGGPTQLGGAEDRKIINGAKRLVAYIIPHPLGYDFNTSELTEKSGSKEVPLLPDPEVWQCEYSGGDKLQSACSNLVGGYVANGYSNVNDTFVNSVFPITSAYRSTILGKHGGMIRWDNDGLVPESDDPFTTSGVTCNGITGSCVNVSALGSRGVIVGNLTSSSVQIPNNLTKAVKISLKSLVGNNGCNTTFPTLTVTDSALNVITTYTNVNISNSSWTTENITLEPTQKLVIPLSANYTYPAGLNCGLSIGAKITPHHDILIEESGFVRLTMLQGSGSCNINGRIVNPLGSHVNLDSNYTADFYEYDSFATTSSQDPLNSLNVPASPGVGSKSWTNSFFVRKGQIIRLSPESWNGEWTTSAGSQRKCGIGMAMTINPRPALLCRGKADDVINNPTCFQDYSNGQLIGCQAVEPNCNINGSGLTCNQEICRGTITACTNGTALNNYQKTNCTITAPSPSCVYDTNSTLVSCAACTNAMLAAAMSPAKTSINNIDQCYDLENYKGKVSNIPDSNSLTKVQVDTFLDDSARAKGLTKLRSFSNLYGNLDNFSDSGDIDPANNNIIYDVKSPLIFTTSGRLKFFALDGKDFKTMESSYNNNSVPGANYSGSNGYMINTSGTLEFNNGTWLQARLCAELSDDTVICKNNDPIRLTNQPQILELSAPSPSSPVGAAPTVTSGYKFNDYGVLTRVTSSPEVGDCTESVTGIESYAGAPYYCHTHNYRNKDQLEAMSEGDKDALNTTIRNLRISFKIFDPEVGNCDLTALNSGDGIETDNPFHNGNTNGTCISYLGEVPGDGTTENPGTCRKANYCANKYSNNSGKYYVNVKVKNSTDGTISNIIGRVINPIVEIMDGEKDNPNTLDTNEYKMGQAERVYRLLIGDPRYQAILTIALVTMFTFYGFGYLIGVVEMNHGDIISRIIKIGLIYLFVGETGWQWFNDIVVKFFKESTDYLAFMMASSFDNSPELMNAITDGNYYDKSVLFGSVDKVFELFFSTAVRKKVSALLFASIFGWAYLFIIYSSFILYVYAVANAVLLYLTAQVFISILFVLGPIFFVFTLFSQTKEMFDNWLKQLIGFSLQQIFLLTTLAFFNMLMYEVLKMSLGYKICWDEVWTINIITRITLLSFWTIASLPPRTNAHSEVGNIGNPEGIPSLFTILFIWVIASLMHKFITFMTNLASSISGGLSASSLGKGVADFAAAAQKGAGQWAGKLADTAGFNPVRSLDKALFDSGKLAEEARAKQKKQNSMDLNNKSSMAKAGDKAVSQYKIDNAKELMTMSQAEQKKRLNEVSDKAMTSKGKALGLNDDQIKSLKSDTGLKYTGSNVFGAGIQAIRQGARTGGSLSTSLKDRNSEKDIQQFSHSEGQKALKNMSKDERAEFIKHAKEGDVSVGKSALNRKAEILATPFKAIGNAASSALKIVHDKEYNEAAKELEKTGAIDKHSVKIPFTNKKINLGAFRNSRQKDLINEKLKNNKEAQKVNPDTHKYAVAELEREANSLEKDEKISESDDGIMSKALGKTANALGRGLRLGNYAAEAKKNSADNKAKVQQKNIEDNDRNMDELSEARDDAMNEVEEAQSELEKVPGYDEMSKLAEEVSNNPNASRGQKAKLARLEKNVYGTEQGLNLKKAQMAVHGIDDEMNNVKIRQEKVGGTKNNSNNSSDTEA